MNHQWCQLAYQPLWRLDRGIRSAIYVPGCSINAAHFARKRSFRRPNFWSSELTFFPCESWPAPNQYRIKKPFRLFQSLKFRLLVQALWKSLLSKVHEDHSQRSFIKERINWPGDFASRVSLIKPLEYSRNMHIPHEARCSIHYFFHIVNHKPVQSTRSSLKNFAWNSLSLPSGFYHCLPSLSIRRSRRHSTAI